MIVKVTNKYPICQLIMQVISGINLFFYCVSTENLLAHLTFLY